MEGRDACATSGSAQNNEETSGLLRAQLGLRKQSRVSYADLCDEENSQGYDDDTPSYKFCSSKKRQPQDTRDYVSVKQQRKGTRDRFRFEESSTESDSEFTIASSSEASTESDRESEMEDKEEMIDSPIDTGKQFLSVFPNAQPAVLPPVYRGDKYKQPFAIEGERRIKNIYKLSEVNTGIFQSGDGVSLEDYDNEFLLTFNRLSPYECEFITYSDLYSNIYYRSKITAFDKKKQEISGAQLQSTHIFYFEYLDSRNNETRNEVEPTNLATGEFPSQRQDNSQLSLPRRIESDQLYLDMNNTTVYEYIGVDFSHPGIPERIIDECVIELYKYPCNSPIYKLEHDMVSFLFDQLDKCVTFFLTEYTYYKRFKKHSSVPILDNENNNIFGNYNISDNSCLNTSFKDYDADFMTFLKSNLGSIKIVSNPQIHLNDICTIANGTIKINYQALPERLQVKRVLVKWIHYNYDNCSWVDPIELKYSDYYVLHYQFITNNMVPLPPKPHWKWKNQINKRGKDPAAISFTPFKVNQIPLRGVCGDNMSTLHGSGFERKTYDYALKQYQVFGINWIYHGFCNHINRILADEMGLGKTLQAILFINLLAYHYNFKGPFLIVSPLILVNQWVLEIKKWTYLDVVAYTGTKDSRYIISRTEMFYPTRKDIEQSVNKDPDWYEDKEVLEEQKDTEFFSTLSLLANFNGNVVKYKDVPRFIAKPMLIITSYEQIMKNLNIKKKDDDLFLFSDYNYSALVIDEAHRLKSYNSKLYALMLGLHANFRLLLTGTPIQNNIDELFNLLYFINPTLDKDEFIEKYGILNSAQEVDNEDISGGDDKTRLVEALRSLQELLNPVMLMRKKSNVVSIPQKTEYFIYLNLTKTQKYYYKATLERNIELLTSVNKNKTKTTPKLMNMVMLLRKICNHTYLIDGADKKYFELEGSGSQLDAIVNSSSKTMFLNRLIDFYLSKPDEKNRILIFSQFLEVLTVIGQILQMKGLRYQRIDGSTSQYERISILQSFSDQSDNNILLVSSHSGSHGLNLSLFNIVVLFDSDYNPLNDIQAYSRAHRIGQRREVKIYRLIIKDSYEDQMWCRSERKLGMVKCIEDGNAEQKAKEPSEPDTDIDLEHPDRTNALDVEGLVGNINTQSNSSANTQPQATQLEMMLKKGAFYMLQNEENDIETIFQSTLAENTQQPADNNIDAVPSDVYTKMSLNMNDDDINMNDPDFWKKLLPNAAGSKAQNSSKKEKYENERTDIFTPEEIKGLYDALESRGFGDWATLVSLAGIRAKGIQVSSPNGVTTPSGVFRTLSEVQATAMAIIREGCDYIERKQLSNKITKYAKNGLGSFVDMLENITQELLKYNKADAMNLEERRKYILNKNTNKHIERALLQTLITVIAIFNGIVKVDNAKLVPDRKNIQEIATLSTEKNELKRTKGKFGVYLTNTLKLPFFDKIFVSTLQRLSSVQANTLPIFEHQWTFKDDLELVAFISTRSIENTTFEAYDMRDIKVAEDDRKTFSEQLHRRAEYIVNCILRTCPESVLESVLETYNSESTGEGADSSDGEKMDVKQEKDEQKGSPESIVSINKLLESARKHLDAEPEKKKKEPVQKEVRKRVKRKPVRKEESESSEFESSDSEEMTPKETKRRRANYQMAAAPRAPVVLDREAIGVIYNSLNKYGLVHTYQIEYCKAAEARTTVKKGTSLYMPEQMPPSPVAIHDLFFNCTQKPEPSKASSLFEGIVKLVSDVEPINAPSAHLMPFLRSLIFRICKQPTDDTFARVITEEHALKLVKRLIHIEMFRTRFLGDVHNGHIKIKRNGIGSRWGSPHDNLLMLGICVHGVNFDKIWVDTLLFNGGKACNPSSPMRRPSDQQWLWKQAVEAVQDVFSRGKRSAVRAAPNKRVPSPPDIFK